MEEPKVNTKRRILGCVGCLTSPILLLIGLGVVGSIKGGLNSVRAYELVVKNDYFNNVATYEELMALPFFSEKEVTEYLEVESYKYAELNHAMYYVLFKKEEPRLLVFFYRNGFLQINRHMDLRDTKFREGIEMDLPYGPGKIVREALDVLNEKAPKGRIDYDFTLLLERKSK